MGFFSATESITFHIMRNCSVCVSSCVLNVKGGGGPLKGPCGPPTHAETKHVRNKEKHAAHQPAFGDWEPVFSLAPGVLGARARSSCETGPLIAAPAPFLLNSEAGPEPRRWVRSGSRETRRSCDGGGGDADRLQQPECTASLQEAVRWLPIQEAVLLLPPAGSSSSRRRETRHKLT